MTDCGLMGIRLLLATGLALMGVPGTDVFASGSTIIPQDRNFGINVQDVRADGSATTLLYSTHPIRGQAHLAEKCTNNFYLLELRPGLDNPQPQLVGKDVCASFGIMGRLLADNDVLIFMGTRIETWRAGKGKIKTRQTGAMAGLRGLQAKTESGAIFIDAVDNGEFIVAETVGGTANRNYSDSSIAVVRITADDKTRWRVKLKEPGVAAGVSGAWAGKDGGAMVHLLVRADPADAAIPGGEAPAGLLVSDDVRLYSIDAAGQLSKPIILSRTQQADFKTIQSEPDAFQRNMNRAVMESIKNIAVQERDGGGFDVLFERSSGDEARNGHYLYRVAGDGTVEAEINLSTAIVGEGVERWKDFYTTRNQLVLYSTVLARQSVVSSRRKSYMQGAISWIDLPSGSVITRLVPLDERYLEAAMNAGDEQIQYLENMPGGEAQLLTQAGGQPVAVSVGKRSGRSALLLEEGSRQLAVYTDVRDDRQAKLAKETQKKQRKADREARSQSMNADMAAAIGVSQEEYDAMSNKERKEAMVRQGDLDAIDAMAAKHAGSAQQQASGQQKSQRAAGQQALPQGLPPGLSPEMQAQLATAMAQAQQAMAEAGMTMPNMPGMPATAAAAPAKGILTVDEKLRGTVKYQHVYNLPMTLVVLNRNDGKELLKKDYPQGRINELIDFSQFKLPLSQIGIVYRDISNQVLGDLTPALAQ